MGPERSFHAKLQYGGLKWQPINKFQVVFDRTQRTLTSHVL